jgi:hypothetical protein
MNLLRYYFDYFKFNFETFPLVIRIATTIILIFLTFNLFLIITLLVKKFLNRKKDKLEFDKQSKCFRLLETIVTYETNITYEVLQQKQSSFKETCGSNNKKIIKILLAIKSDFPEKFNYYNLQSISRLFDLGKFWDEHLSKGTLKQKIESLDEIIELNASISESILSTLVYHKNNELRKRARIAQIHLSQHDPFRFFEEEFDKDFTEWDKIKIHNILLHRPIKTIPNFARWIPKIKNEDLQCLFVYEIGYFLQYENRDFLFDFFKNTTSDKVKIQCLKTLDLLGIKSYKERLIKLYPISSEEVQLSIIESLKNIRNENEVLKFFIDAFEKTYKTNLKIAIGKTIYQSGENGKKVVNILENRVLGFDRLILAHIKNPLLAN